MTWRSGTPVTSGFYLCAVIGNSKPTELYWNGSSWAFLVEYDGWERIHAKDVACYIDMNDIPMPEGW